MEVKAKLVAVAGWTAVTGSLSYGAVVLFLLLFIWQLPHFYAIAWFCREDYRKAGFKMLAVMDPDGSRTARQIIVHSVILLGVSLSLFFLKVTGYVYFIVAVVMGLWLLVSGFQFLFERTDKQARVVMKLVSRISGIDSPSAPTAQVRPRSGSQLTRSLSCRPLRFGS